MCVMTHLLSLPLWERGFKQFAICKYVADPRCRSPCGSVDLNTAGFVIQPAIKWSLPLWERGFKRKSPIIHEKTTLSLPLWERGFKL